MSTSTNKTETTENPPAKNEETSKAPPAPLDPPVSNDKGNEDDKNRRPTKKDPKPVMVGLIFGLVCLLLIGLITMVVKLVSGGDSTEVVAQEQVIPPVIMPSPVIPPMGEWESVPPTPRASEPRGTEVPPVVDWVSNNGHLVPVRLMPDGRKAGYGVSYTNPPEGGGKLPPNAAIAQAIKAKTAAWTRNERGDWAIKL
jgi:hypothetical protein